MAKEEPTKAELGEAVERLGLDLKKATKGIKGWRDKFGGAKEKLSTTAKVAPFTPFLGLTIPYLTGRADATLGNEDVKYPVTAAVGVLSWVGSVGCAIKGWSIPAILLGNTAAVTAGAVMHDVGYDAGQKSKAQG